MISGGVAGLGGLISGGLGVAGGLEGLFGGGGANSVQLPPQQSINLGGITNSLDQAIPQLGSYNLGGQNLGQYSGALQTAINNPYGGGAVNTAAAFGPMGSAIGGQGVGNALNIGGTVNPLIQASFDPQNALYARTADQTSQQSLAALSGSGLANTPYGQSTYGSTMNNFNIDWQNNQLQRMLQGVSGAQGAATGAENAGFGAISGATDTGMLPFNTYGTVSGAPLNLLQGGSDYGTSAAQIPQMGIGDWLSYLSGGNQANSVANQQAQLALNQQQQAFNQTQAYGKEIGAGLGSIFGGGSWLNNIGNSWGGGASVGK
jgi:hypothetical protein